MLSFSTHLTRLLQGLFTLLLTLFGLLLVTFSLSALSPVDRVLQIVGDHASQSTYDQVRHQLGLDQPLPVQFWHYLVNLAHGDLGIASATGQPVLHDLLAVFPATLELATLALIVGAVLGIVAGVLCARYAGSPWDLAVGNFLLGVAAMGLDAVPIEGVDFAILDEEFDLKAQGYTSLVVVPVGHHSVEDFNATLPKSRLPQSTTITEI
ncbi:TPA: hypothetical protein MIS09_11780 [Klebsiella pneumoniae]|nr:hypothetical protein [Klebsiella pneumoniae]